MGLSTLTWVFITLLSLYLVVAWGIVGARWWIIAVIPAGALLGAISIFLCCMWRAFGLPHTCAKHGEWYITGACMDCFDDKVKRGNRFRANKDAGN